MRPMRDLDSILRNALLSLLLGSGEFAEEIADDLSRRGEWLRLVRLAEAWHVLPRVTERLSELRVILEPEARSALRQKSAAAFVCSMQRARRGIEALRLLEGNGVPAAAFKGLASMAILYPNPALRTIGDADILVPEPDLRNAIALLVTLGLKPEPGDLSNFSSKWPGSGGNQAIHMGDGVLGNIDLHWRLGPDPTNELDPRRVITRVQTACLFGFTIRVVAAADGLLLTTRHSLRNNFAPALICRDLLDFRLWCDHLDQNHGIAGAIDRAQQCGLLVPIFAMSRIHARFDPAHAEHPAAREIEASSTAAERKSAERLVDLFVSQIKHGTLNEDVVHLVHSGYLRQVVTWVSRDWREYRRLMKSMGKSAGAPSPLWKRFTRVAQVAVRLTREDLRGLRVLGTMKNR